MARQIVTEPLPQLPDIDGATTIRHVGRIVDAHGTTIQISGLPVSIGQTCRLYDPDSDWSMTAEVIGVNARGGVLQPFGHLRGLSSRARVEALGSEDTVRVDDSLLGRVVDAFGNPIDGAGSLRPAGIVPVRRAPPAPMERRPIDRPIETGIRAIDTLLTCGQGQRMGIFAPAGAGKSTLLGMLATHSAADVNVVALIGERGREVREFIADNLAGCLHKSIVVVATSDEPSLMRARAAQTATAIAEYFRERGLQVQLLADSLTRYARALRDVGLATGEAATRNDFPPSVLSELPQLLERAGTDGRGSITAFYTMLIEAEDDIDPIAEETMSILDGHIVLSRKLAMQGHYPAIDILSSVSRLMPQLISAEHGRGAERAREFVSRYRDLELLLQMGEYEPGQDPEADAAIAAQPGLARLLRQALTEEASFDDSVRLLTELTDG